MTDFTLHPQLVKDTITIGRLPLCTVQLMNNSLFPWVILVPMRGEIRELFDLRPSEQAMLLGEISAVAQAMQQHFAADKMNIAALGNMVPQLHWHVITRFKSDSAWPHPVWGRDQKAYTPNALVEMSQKCQQAFADIPFFRAIETPRS